MIHSLLTLISDACVLCCDVLVQIAGWDMRRVITSRGANLLANLLLNPGVSDLTGSFRLYKKNVLEDLMRCVKGRTYVFQMEVSRYGRRLTLTR